MSPVLLAQARPQSGFPSPSRHFGGAQAVHASINLWEQPCDFSRSRSSRKLLYLKPMFYVLCSIYVLARASYSYSEIDMSYYLSAEGQSSLRADIPQRAAERAEERHGGRL